jgi:DNA-binding TFAR19-related protein (PDSD5 family)
VFISRALLDSLVNRIKLVKPQVAEKVEMALLTAMQRGQLQGKVNEARVKELLEGVGGAQATKSKVVVSML